MSGPRVPRWLLVAAASFVAYWALLAWSSVFPPVGAGVVFNIRGDRVFAVGVPPESTAYQAGIRNGDRILEVNGFPLRRLNDVFLARANALVGQPQSWRLERGGAVIDTITTPPARRVFLGRRNPLEIGFALAMVAFGVSLAVGVMIAVRRPHDRSALLAAWLLASLGCVSAPLWPPGLASAWRSLPAPIAWLLWPACISSLLIPLQMYVLFARFPRRAMSGRALALTLAPGLLVAAYVTTYVLLAVLAPQRAVALPLPVWLQVAGPASSPAYMAAGAFVLWRQRRLVLDANDRRRVQILLAGAASAGAGLFLIAFMLVATALGIDVPGVASIISLLGGVFLLLLLPFSFAYVILRHRLFDVRVIVRLGLQYALARGALLSIMPGVAALLLADVLLHGDSTLNQVLAGRGWIYAALAGAAAVVYRKRDGWLAALDRRFFRETYAAQWVLRDVVDQARRAGSVQSAASNVAARIETALHPTVAVVLIRAPGSDVFTPCGVPGRGDACVAPTPLPAESPIVKLLRALERPLVLVPGEHSGLWRQLPADSQAWLQAAGFELLVPIAVGGGAESILALGPKRSEEPYSAEDLDLLSAVASSLALVDAVPASPAAGATPRRIANRYEVQRLLGSGGMGAVYEAMDIALDRLVAVKVMREDLAGRADAADRFRREARAAASFTHPNVVTVYDFGIAEGAPYLVMERLVGRTLRERLRESRRLSAGETVQILRGAAAALDAAHRASLIHRDLKPENVFLADGEGAESVKLLDFGVAKLLSAGAVPDSATASGILVGTVAYMAPEQISGGAPSPAWDVWALNVTAYESLAGAHPFGLGGPLTAAPAILAGRWTPLRQHVPDAPDAWQEYFARAFSFEPARRPATASAAVDELAACIRGLARNDGQA